MTKFCFLLGFLLAGELLQVWSRKWLFSPGFSPRRILLAFTEAFFWGHPVGLRPFFKDRAFMAI